MHTTGDKLALNDVAHAHTADLICQDAHGVQYLRYWADVNSGKIFCLVDAPDAETAASASAFNEIRKAGADKCLDVRAEDDYY